MRYFNWSRRTTNRLKNEKSKIKSDARSDKGWAQSECRASNRNRNPPVFFHRTCTVYLIICGEKSIHMSNMVLRNFYNRYQKYLGRSRASNLLSSIYLLPDLHLPTASFSAEFLIPFYNAFPVYCANLPSHRRSFFVNACNN